MKYLPDLWRRSTLLPPTRSSLGDLQDLQKRVDRLFEDITLPLLSSGELDLIHSVKQASFIPMCDIDETDTHYLMSFDLPGVKKENLAVSIQDGFLLVSGERKEENKHEDKNHKRSERFYGTFQRTFAIPSGIEVDQIGAYYQDGVLRLAIPKNEQNKAQSVKINEEKPGFWEKVMKKNKAHSEQKEHSAA